MLGYNLGTWGRPCARTSLPGELLMFPNLVDHTFIHSPLRHFHSPQALQILKTNPSEPTETEFLAENRGFGGFTSSKANPLGPKWPEPKKRRHGRTHTSASVLGKVVYSRAAAPASATVWSFS